MADTVDEVTRAHVIACAVSYAIWGSELGWTHGDYKALIAEMQRRSRAMVDFDETMRKLDTVQRHIENEGARRHTLMTVAFIIGSAGGFVFGWICFG